MDSDSGIAKCKGIGAPAPTGEAFDVFLLPLERRSGESEDYGIVGMEIDPDSGVILVLGNSEHRLGKLPPAIWTWQPADPGAVQEPTLCNDAFSPPRIPGKPEAIAIARAPDGKRDGWPGRLLGSSEEAILAWDAEDGHLYYQALSYRSLCRWMSSGGE